MRFRCAVFMDSRRELWGCGRVAGSPFRRGASRAPDRPARSSSASPREPALRCLSASALASGSGCPSTACRPRSPGGARSLTGSDGPSLPQMDVGSPPGRSDYAGDADPAPRRRFQMTVPMGPRHSLLSDPRGIAPRTSVTPSVKAPRTSLALAGRETSRRPPTSPETTAQTSGGSPDHPTTPGLSSTAAEQRLSKA